MKLSNRALRQAAVGVAATGLAALGLGAVPAATADDNSGMVVTVTSQAQADRVRAAGGTPQRVSFTGAELQQAMDRLNRDALVPGTAWSIDPARNQVVATYDESVTGARHPEQADRRRRGDLYR